MPTHTRMTRMVIPTSRHRFIRGYGLGRGATDDGRGRCITPARVTTTTWILGPTRSDRVFSIALPSRMPRFTSTVIAASITDAASLNRPTRISRRPAMLKLAKWQYSRTNRSENLRVWETL